MSTDPGENSGYDVVLTRSARRALEELLPEAVAAAASSSSLARCAPIRTASASPCASRWRPCLWSARRGEYRVLYRILERRLVIEGVSVVHRRDAYRQ